MQALNLRLQDGGATSQMQSDTRPRMLLYVVAFVAGVALTSTFFTVHKHQSLDKDPQFTPF